MTLRVGLYNHHVPMQGLTVTANTSGIATAAYSPVPEGYAWYIERYSVHCPTSASIASVNVILGTVSQVAANAALDTSARADYTINGKDAVGDSNSAIYVAPGYSLVIQWTAATSGDICIASIQYAVHELEPRKFMSPEDLRQVAAAGQHATGPVTQTATAEYRATDNAPEEDLHVVDPDPFIGSPN